MQKNLIKDGFTENKIDEYIYIYSKSFNDYEIVVTLDAGEIYWVNLLQNDLINPGKRIITPIDYIKTELQLKYLIKSFE